MKLNGNITIRFKEPYTTIEIEDNNSGAKFLTIELTTSQLMQVLGGLCSVKCTLNINDLDIVGKTLEVKDFCFPISSDLADSKYSEELKYLADSKLSDGWVADNYFGSQNTFYRDTNNKMNVKCLIRRWV